MRNTEKNVERLEELRDDIEILLHKMENTIDDYRNVLNEIERQRSGDTEKIFAPFIDAGLIPGAYFMVTEDDMHVYKIVAIKADQYGVIDVNKPEKVINMPLERDGKSFLERYIKIDEKTAMEKAELYGFSE
jgi:hypothetical protein